MKPKGNKRKENKTLEGVIKVTAKPLGFVSVEGREEDIIIHEESLNCALNRDMVEVEITGKDRGRDKGRVVRIVERSKTEFVGTIEKRGDTTILKPDDWKFYRAIELTNPSKETKPDLKALARLTSWNNPNLNPKGELVEVIGKKGEHETEMQSILLDKGIVYDFPPQVEAEAEKFKDLKIEELDTEDRRDFRNITTFTIDPVDAKDFDDALSYEVLDDKTLRIGVHIADVSHFVRPGTALDREARERSFSVYLVDRTIPMLPEILSNGLCSLNPNVDRLAFSAVFDIDKESGKVKERWFGKTVINSDKRFSYQEAQELLDNSQQITDNSNEKFQTEIFELNRLADIYREQNRKNGAIEFETDEVKFELDDKGKPIRVYKKPRLATMKMIEEWMLLANREVARYISTHLEKRGGASIFRTHDIPNQDKIEELSIFVRALGHELHIAKNGEVTAKDLNALLKSLEGKPEESLVRTAAVRSMSKAIYSTQNTGHFGLAFEYYTHFTSPIRRYPDLIIHRILDKHLSGGKIDQDELAKYRSIASHATEKEIAAANAERDSIKYKQVEYMLDKVGQEFDGVISGVTEWGIYVEEPESKAEGMVRLKDIEGDYYNLDEKNYAVVGEKTKNKYQLGDKVRVKLMDADLDRKTLDFKLIR